MLFSEKHGHTFGAPLIRLQPDLFQPLSEASFLPVRNLGQDIAYEVDLAALPARPKPFLADCCRTPRGLNTEICCAVIAYQKHQFEKVMEGKADSGFIQNLCYCAILGKKKIAFSHIDHISKREC